MKISSRILKVTKQAIKAALAYEKETNRVLGITGEIGEILACHKLKLDLLSDGINPGFDATDDNDKRYQIKAKRTRKKGGNPTGNIGSFSKHKDIKN